MPASRFLALVVGLTAAPGVLFVGPALAQELPTVAPDRPNVANSTQTVPPRFAQLETGGEYASAKVATSPAERRASLQTTLRVGLLDRLEASVDARPVVWLRGQGEDTGPGDVTLALKYRFLDAVGGGPWPSLGIQPFVKLPAASVPIGSGRVDAGASLLASFDLPKGFSLDANAGVAAIGQSGASGFLPQGSASVSLGWSFAEPLSAFAELAWQSKADRDGRHQLLLDAGLTYTVLRWLALDLAMGTTLTGRGPEVQIRAGVSVLIGR